MFNTRHDRTLCGGVGAELVNDDARGKAAMFFLKSRRQALGGCCVTVDLGDFVEDIALPVDGSPEITFLAVD